MRNQIVILAAGKGKRMGGSVPKVLIMLKNKPLIFYLLHEIEKINQLIKPVVVVGFMKDKVQGVLGENYIYAVQEPQLGTGHAVLCAKNKIKGQNILVLYGDMPFISANSLKSLMRMHHKKESLISMFTASVPDFGGKYKSLEHFGRIIRNFKGDIIKITEFKDANESEKKIREVNPGIYMFNTKWLWNNIKCIKNKNAQGEYYLTDIVEVAIKQGIIVNSLSVDPREVLGVNNKEDFELAESLL